MAQCTASLRTTVSRSRLTLPPSTPTCKLSLILYVQPCSHITLQHRKHHLLQQGNPHQLQLSPLLHHHVTRPFLLNIVDWIISRTRRKSYVVLTRLANSCPKHQEVSITYMFSWIHLNDGFLSLSTPTSCSRPWHTSSSIVLVSPILEAGNLHPLQFRKFYDWNGDANLQLTSWSDTRCMASHEHMHNTLSWLPQHFFDQWLPCTHPTESLH
jgi:hypothetical protein